MKTIFRADMREAKNTAWVLQCASEASARIKPGIPIAGMAGEFSIALRRSAIEEAQPSAYLALLGGIPVPTGGEEERLSFAEFPPKAERRLNFRNG